MCIIENNIHTYKCCWIFTYIAFIYIYSFIHMYNWKQQVDSVFYNDILVSTTSLQFKTVCACVFVGLKSVLLHTRQLDYLYTELDYLKYVLLHIHGSLIICIRSLFIWIVFCCIYTAAWLSASCASYCGRRRSTGSLHGKMMKFIVNMFAFVLKMTNFIVNMFAFLLKMTNFIVKVFDFVMKMMNVKLFDFVMKMMNFIVQMLDYVLKMLDFAGSWSPRQMLSLAARWSRH